MEQPAELRQPDVHDRYLVRQPNAERIALTLFRDAVEEFPQNRETLEKAFKEKAPELPREGGSDGTGDPEEAFEAQREGAPERP